MRPVILIVNFPKSVDFWLKLDDEKTQCIMGVDPNGHDPSEGATARHTFSRFFMGQNKL